MRYLESWTPNLVNIITLDCKKKIVGLNDLGNTDFLNGGHFPQKMFVFL